MTAQDLSDWKQGLQLSAGPYFMGLYQPSPETVFYWEGVRAGELRLRWCEACQVAHHPKRIVCDVCGCADLGTRRAKGSGKVYSFSVVHRAPDAAFEGSVPYTVGLVELNEGVFLFTRFIYAEGQITIGAQVSVEFRELERGVTLPVFRVEAT